MRKKTNEWTNEGKKNKDGDFQCHLNSKAFLWYRCLYVRTDYCNKKKSGIVFNQFVLIIMYDKLFEKILLLLKLNLESLERKVYISS